MSKIMHCWPIAWLDAAVKAGLAVRSDEGTFLHGRLVGISIIGGDDMREKLAAFASSIIESNNP